MIKSNRIFATSMAVLCAFCANDARAAQNAPTLMSKYGEIQSVNKYSSNPFWTPNSPYNQRFPTPIYATGADLTAGDCNRIVGNLVSEYCAGHNYCSNSRLADIRPTVMVQLSQLPGHNFATSCGGYIDSIFENYKKTYGNTSTNNVVKPAQQNAATIQINTPFKQKKSEYEIGVAERTAELEGLQRQTTPTAELSATAFPKTIDDLSFTDRVANTTAGYEPYKNLNAYKTPKFETEDEYYERMRELLEHDITYIGADAGGCPSKYLTGRGATVSCTPTRQNGTCTAWCTDAALTDCKTSFTISPNDRDDKTFYGKCVCDDGYKDDGQKCVRENAPAQETIVNDDTVTPVVPDDQIPNNCPDPDYMDANCECTVVPNTHFDDTTQKCVCDNGKDISQNCDDGNDSIETYRISTCRYRATNGRRSAYWRDFINSEHHTDNDYQISGRNDTNLEQACNLNILEIVHCISSNTTNGIINRKIKEHLGVTASGVSDNFSLFNNNTNNFHFDATQEQMSNFLDSLNNDDVQSFCSDGNWAQGSRTWAIIIEKYDTSTQHYTVHAHKTLNVNSSPIYPQSQ